MGLAENIETLNLKLKTIKEIELWLKPCFVLNIRSLGFKQSILNQQEIIVEILDTRTQTHHDYVKLSDLTRSSFKKYRKEEWAFSCIVHANQQVFTSPKFSATYIENLRIDSDIEFRVDGDVVWFKSSCDYAVNGFLYKSSKEAALAFALHIYEHGECEVIELYPGISTTKAVKLDSISADEVD